MIENIIYHSVIVIFIILLLIYTIHLKQKLTTVEQGLFPFLVKKQFFLPKDRSIFVRGIQSLESELGKKLNCAVSIKFNNQNDTFYSDDFILFFEILSSSKKLDFYFPNIHKSNSQKIIFEWIKTEPDHTLALKEKKLSSSKWEVHIL